MLTDTHLHLDFLPAGPRLLDAARAAGIGAWIVPGVAPGQWPRLMARVAGTPGAWAAPGVHPHHAGEWRPELAGELGGLLSEPRVVAIGEVGLDGQVGPELAVQEDVFRQMIRLACARELPLLLHMRRAMGRVLTILAEEGAAEVGGIAHAFSGSLETARQLIALGFALGIGGVATFPEARRLETVIRTVPDEWLVLETDAPDLPPHPHRHEENRPEWLVLVAARVAELKGWLPEETARITTCNARRVLRLPVEKDLTP